MAFRFLLAIGLLVLWACSDEEFTGPDNPSVTATTGSGGQGGAASSASAQASTASGSGGGAPVCQSLGDPCSDCVHTSCNTEYCTCYAEQDCAALVNCFNGCVGDAVCQQGCMSTPEYQDYISQVLMLGDCAAATCGGECPGVVEQQPCAECLLTSCESQMNACLADVPCAETLDCAQACQGDLGCIFACPNMSPSLSSAVLMCMQQQCPTPCGA